MQSIFQKLGKAKLDNAGPEQENRHNGHKHFQTAHKIILRIPHKMFSHILQSLWTINKEKYREDSSKHVNNIEQDSKLTIIYNR